MIDFPKNQASLISAILGCSFITSVSSSQVPLKPTPRAIGLDQAILITWDDTAQHASAFAGYRLYRARLSDGPYNLIRQWTPDASGSIPNQFFDVGDDNGDGTVKPGEGLRNEVEYFYRVSAYADSTSMPPIPFVETYSAVVSATPVPAATNYAAAQITLVNDTGFVGDWKTPKLIVSNPDIFNRLEAGHSIGVSISTVNSGFSYVFPVTVSDPAVPNDTRFFADMSLSVLGDSTNPGLKNGTYAKDNIFGYGALAIQLDWQYEQLRKPLRLDSVFVASKSDDSTDTPVLYSDTSGISYVGLIALTRTIGEKDYEVKFVTGGTDTVDAASKKYFQFYNVQITELHSGRVLQAGGVQGSQDVPAVGTWTISRFTVNARTGASVESRRAANRYYIPSFVDSTHSYIFANVFYIEGIRFVCDYTNTGRTPGKQWPRAGRVGTRDFSPGDKLLARVTGGVRGLLPLNAWYSFTIGQPRRVTTTDSILDRVHIVPNPYVVRHEAQRAPVDRRLFFADLPEQCTIRIYTVALDLVKTIYHTGGGVHEWDLRNDNGNLVASQLFIAVLESANGAVTTKKFSVVRGE